MISCSKPRRRRALARFFLLAGSACLLGTGTPPAAGDKVALSEGQLSPASGRGALAFPERVAYQWALEEVYWRHRIWPKENVGPKPALEAVISPQALEQKVSGYLRKSQVLADRLGQPITAAQLQAEMDRMGQHTRQSEVLRELFAAVGNDPFVIAECLARPILAERLVNELSAHAGLEVFVSNAWALAARSVPPSQMYQLPKISAPRDCADNTWTATTTVNVPAARHGQTAVWTGSEMIIWGGSNFDGDQNIGGRYSPSTDSWTVTAIANAPVARGSHTAVWTGSEMIVWGGLNSPGGHLNTGGRYNVATDSWTATAIANAPVARGSHTAVWTGSEMIVWGGVNNTFWMNTGGRYNPATDSWLPTSINAPSRRWDHTAVWTGSEMIVWGGTDQTNYLDTGGRYNPTTDSWTPTGLANVPPGRVSHTGVWTGSEMIVWGGVDNNLNDLNTGGRYRPGTDSWVPTSQAGAPLPRDSHTAVWTGREMIIWGGHRYPPGIYDNSGGRYDAFNDSWTPTSTANAPSGRQLHAAVWTGGEMVVWGGSNFDDPNVFPNTGGRYCAQPSTPIAQSVVSRKTHGNVGSPGVDLPLSGAPGMECRSGGATGDYTIVVTFLANVSVDGTPQATVNSGIGAIGTGGVSNGGMVMTSENVVTIPLTNVANAQTIHITVNNVNGSTNVTIPMRVLIGDVNGNGAVNASDISQVKAVSGQPVGPNNFRADVNANGSINATDVSLVKSFAGTGLP